MSLRSLIDPCDVEVAEYKLSEIIDRQAQHPSRKKRVDVHFSKDRKLLKTVFDSEWDEAAKADEQKHRADLLERHGFGSLEANFSPDGHRVVFHTDDHFSRVCSACLDVSSAISDVIAKLLLISALWQDTDMEGVVNRQFKCLYTALVISTDLWWMSRSLDKTRKVIFYDSKYYGNFFSDPKNGWSCCGIACIKFKSIFCGCFKKTVEDHVQLRSFELWTSIFMMCAFGISKDVMEIISILHPEKTEARSWPCFELKSNKTAASTARGAMHRVWMYWFPGSRMEYNFENHAMKLNAGVLKYPKMAAFVINLYIFIKTWKPLVAVTMVTGFLGFYKHLHTTDDVNYKDFTEKQLEDLQMEDPLVKFKAKRNMDIYELWKRGKGKGSYDAFKQTQLDKVETDPKAGRNMDLLDLWLPGEKEAMTKPRPSEGP